MQSQLVSERFPLYCVKGGHPFNTVCVPLNYSGNPGVKRRTLQGGVHTGNACGRMGGLRALSLRGVRTNCIPCFLSHIGEPATRSAQQRGRTFFARVSWPVVRTSLLYGKAEL